MAHNLQAMSYGLRAARGPVATRQTASARCSCSSVPFTAFEMWIAPVGPIGTSDRETGGNAIASSACDVLLATDTIAFVDGAHGEGSSETLRRRTARGGLPAILTVILPAILTVILPAILPPGFFAPWAASSVLINSKILVHLDSSGLEGYRMTVAHQPWVEK